MERVVQSGRPIHDHERCSEERGLERGCAAHDDRERRVGDRGIRVAFDQSDAVDERAEQRLDLRALDGRGKWKDELRAGPRSLDDLRRAGHGREIQSDLSTPTPREQSDNVTFRVEAMAGEELVAGGTGDDLTDERMPNEERRNAVPVVEGLFKGKDDEHPIDVAPNLPHPVLPPGPDLRADVVDDAEPRAMKLLRQTKIEVWPVDQDHDIGSPVEGGSEESLQRAVQPPNAPDDVGNADDVHVLDVDENIDAARPQLLAAAPEDVDRPRDLAQRIDERGGVAIAGRLTGDDHRAKRRRQREYPAIRFPTSSAISDSRPSARSR